MPILSEELFNKVQSILNAHSQTNIKIEKRYTYMGLVKCAECGCAITAEIKKGRYIYYHCTGGKGKCANASEYVREEKIEAQVEEMLKSITIDEQRLEWIKTALKASHQDEKEFHYKIVQSLQRQIAILQQKMDKAYEDKLEGTISESFWKSKFEQWSSEKDTLLTQLNAHQIANHSYFETGTKILELSNRAYQLYDKQPIKEK